MRTRSSSLSICFFCFVLLFFFFFPFDGCAFINPLIDYIRDVLRFEKKNVITYCSENGRAEAASGIPGSPSERAERG